MKPAKVLFSLFLILGMLTACADPAADPSVPPETPPHATTTAASIPEETQSPTTPPETTSPAVEATVPDGCTFSFFYYNHTRFHELCDFYISPAGEETWYPIYFDDSVSHLHPRHPTAHEDDTIRVMRAYVAYDGPENTQWNVRIEYPNREVSFEEQPLIPQPYSYQWDMVVEIKNNQTLFHLGFVPGFPDDVEDDAEMGEVYMPITAPMFFCPLCPKAWLEPIG